MRKFCAEMVPKNLTTEQKASRRDVGLDLLERLERKPEFFICVITGDESWILEYYSETKSQIREWHIAISPRQRERERPNPKPNQWSFFFDSQGMVHKEFVQTGQIFNHTFYGEVLERLRKRVACVRPGITRTWMLHYDKAPHHTAVSSMNFWLKNNSCGSSAPYAPELSTCEFFLFPGSKTI